jgi:hypothetical protein
LASTAVRPHSLCSHGLNSSGTGTTTLVATCAKALQVPKPPPVIDGQESLFEVGA